MKRALAIDIGASSGRHIVGWTENGEIKTSEVYRFPNGVKEADGHLIWDVDALFCEVVAGIRRALAAFPDIETLSIDTWGVDYVLLRGEEEVRPVYAYRDARNDAYVGRVHERIPFPDLYRKTGIQFQKFNTVYSLYADLSEGRLAGVSDFLMIPEYLMYRLTGVKKKEYTDATTTGMVNTKTHAFDPDIFRLLDLPLCLAAPLAQPGTPLGRLKPEIAREVGGEPLVLLCPTHDTAAAVEAIDMPENAPYISSGTWSLLGVRTPDALTDEKSRESNYSNEGGVGYNRYQKNLTGMWLVQCLRAELCPGKDYGEIAKEAAESDYHGHISVNDPLFLAPKSMKEAFLSSLEASGEPLPKTDADYFRCAYESLAIGYREALDDLEQNTGKKYAKLYIVGGGAKNTFLNALTERETGKEVVALPIEATAIGNLKTQLNRKEK